MKSSTTRSIKQEQPAKIIHDSPETKDGKAPSPDLGLNQEVKIAKASHNHKITENDEVQLKDSEDEYEKDGYDESEKKTSKKTTNRKD